MLSASCNTNIEFLKNIVIIHIPINLQTMRFNLSFAVLVDEQRLAKQNHILHRRMERDQ